MFHYHVIEIRVLRDDVAVACAVCINTSTCRLYVVSLRDVLSLLTLGVDYFQLGRMCTA